MRGYEEADGISSWVRQQLLRLEKRWISSYYYEEPSGALVYLLLLLNLKLPYEGCHLQPDMSTSARTKEVGHLTLIVPNPSPPE